MTLRPGHTAALEAALKGPIFSVALGQHADHACREYNYSTVQFLLKRGWLWERAAIDERTKYFITSTGLDLIIQIRAEGASHVPSFATRD